VDEMVARMIAGLPPLAPESVEAIEAVLRLTYDLLVNPDLASPQPDTAPEDDEVKITYLTPAEIASAQEGMDAASRIVPVTIPDTAPEGSWTADFNTVIGPGDEIIECYVDKYPDTLANPDLAERVAAALNGAPATPAEKDLIDEEEAGCGHLCSDCAENAALDAVARLRSERNQTDG